MATIIKTKLAELLKQLNYGSAIAECIDMNVYNSTSSMRVMGSPKYKNGVRIDPFILRNNDSKFDPSTLVCQSANTSEFRCKTSKCLVKQRGDKSNFSIDVTDDVMETVAAKVVELYPQYMVIKTRGNILILRDDRSANCPICKRKHESENPYVLVGKNGAATLVCRRNDNVRMAIIEPAKTVTVASTNPKIRKTERMALLIKTAAEIKLKHILTKINKNTNKQFLDALKPEMDVNNNIAVASPLGSGKTKALFDYINSLNVFGAIVSIVHRRSLTAAMRSAYKSSGFIIYDEVEGEIRLTPGTRVYIQYESLHRLQFGCDIELLICDEANAICMQYLSKLAKINRQLSEGKFERLCRSAKKSILLDGNLCDRIVNAYNCISGKEYFIWENTTPIALSPKVMLTADNAKFNLEIINKLKSGNKIEIVTTRGPIYCEKTAKFIEEQLPDAGLKILTIHSETENRDEILADVISTWQQYDCVIRSPAVGAGIDFSIPYFDYCFVDVASGSVSGDDVMQAIRRSRHIKSNTYYMYFGKCTRTKMPTTYNGVVKQIEHMNSYNMYRSIAADFSAVIDDDDRYKFRDPNHPLLKFNIWCAAYDNKQKNNIMKRVLESLKRLGAEFTYLDEEAPISAIEKKKVDDALDRITEEIKIADFTATATAADITLDTFVELIGKNKMTKLERSQVNKYKLRHTYKYTGEMSAEWVKKYSDVKPLAMSKHLANRDTDIYKLAEESELRTSSMSDTEKAVKRKTTFMYRVAHQKIRDLYDKHNKTAEFSVKMMEFVNYEIENGNPIFGSKKLKNSNTKYVLGALNAILMNLGWEIQIKSIYKRVGKSGRVFEFDWIDIALNYYAYSNNQNENPDKPIFPKLHS